MKKFALAALFACSLTQADILFHKGSIALGVGVGSGSVTYDTNIGSTTKNYFLFGVSADYFVMDNFSIGASIWNWSGASPTIMQYTLPVTYYFKTESNISPYSGLYYRLTDYSGTYHDNFGNSYSVDATNALGIRAGIAYKVSFGYLGVGIAGEKSLHDGSTTTYPEFTVGFVF